MAVAVSSRKSNANDPDERQTALKDKGGPLNQTPCEPLDGLLKKRQNIIDKIDKLKLEIADLRIDGKNLKTDILACMEKNKVKNGYRLQYKKRVIVCTREMGVSITTENANKDAEANN